ncbi:hypothetical protein ACSQ67_026124 [Phaseolus vulgaris]
MVFTRSQTTTFASQLDIDPFVLETLKAHIDLVVFRVRNQLDKDMELLRAQHHDEIQSLREQYCNDMEVSFQQEQNGQDFEHHTGCRS